MTDEFRNTIKVFYGVGLMFSMVIIIVPRNSRFVSVTNFFVSTVTYMYLISDRPSDGIVTIPFSL